MLEEKDLYGGFLPNVRDTAIASSYVDENRKRGLKSLSKGLLDYEQETYEHVTTREMRLADWDGEGKEIARWFDQVATLVQVDVPIMGEYDQQLEIDGVLQFDTTEKTVMVDGDEMLRVQYKMNQLTAREVLSYGADDTICTTALANHFITVMELENTYHVFEEVETFPAYLTALSYVQGVDFSLEEMAKMEKEDDAEYDKSWAVLRQFLIDVGFDGTVCPQITVVDRAAVKVACEVILGWEFTNLSRKPDKLAKVIEQWADEQDDDEDYTKAGLAGRARHLAILVTEENVETINLAMQQHFSGEPVLDLASPKTMRKFLYDVIGLPVQIVNDVTITERMKLPDLTDAISMHKKFRAGSGRELTAEEKALIRSKAKTDDTAIDYALAFDADKISPEQRDALKAIQVMKKVMTRRSLFYKTYWGVAHWKDRKVHPSINQCGTVTRRYSASDPNVTQLPKLGEGVKFRRSFKPHHRNAVVCSADFSGQELRIAAEISQDKNLLSCYVGDNLKDVHSITAAGAMTIKWGADFVKWAYETYGSDLNPKSEEDQYTLFSRMKDLDKEDPIGKKAGDLRKVAKNVNFGSIYLAKAPKLAETLIMTLEDATVFLEARNARFSGLNDAATASEDECLRRGYSTTLMGARRHLSAQITSPERGEAARAARQSWNFEVQGSAAEMTKLSMARLWLSGIVMKLDMRFWFPVHDELVWSVDIDDAKESLRVVNECMTAPYSTMSVPILSSLSVGHNYGEQIEVGDWFIPERIDKAVSKLRSEMTKPEKETA